MRSSSSWLTALRHLPSIVYNPLDSSPSPTEAFSSRAERSQWRELIPSSLRTISSFAFWRSALTLIFFSSDGLPPLHGLSVALPRLSSGLLSLRLSSTFLPFLSSQLLFPHYAPVQNQFKAIHKYIFKLQSRKCVGPFLFYIWQYKRKTVKGTINNG